MHAFEGVLYFLLVVALYFVPTWIALYRRALNKWRVLVVNAAFGWTFIGWMIALVMALPGNHPQQNVNVTVNNSRKES